MPSFTHCRSLLSLSFIDIRCFLCVRLPLCEVCRVTLMHVSNRFVVILLTVTWMFEEAVVENRPALLFLIMFERQSVSYKVSCLQQLWITECSYFSWRMFLDEWRIWFRSANESLITFIQGLEEVKSGGLETWNLRVIDAVQYSSPFQWMIFAWELPTRAETLACSTWYKHYCICNIPGTDLSMQII